MVGIRKIKMLFLTKGVLNNYLCKFLQPYEKSTLRVTCGQLHDNISVTWNLFLDAFEKKDFQAFAEEAARIGDLYLVELAVRRARKARRLFILRENDMPTAIIRGALRAEPRITNRILKSELMSLFPYKYRWLLKLCVKYSRIDIAKEYLKDNKDPYEMDAYYYHDIHLHFFLFGFLSDLVETNRLCDFDDWKVSILDLYLHDSSFLDSLETWERYYKYYVAIGLDPVCEEDFPYKIMVEHRDDSDVHAFFISQFKKRGCDPKDVQTKRYELLVERMARNFEKEAERKDDWIYRIVIILGIVLLVILKELFY